MNVVNKKKFMDNYQGHGSRAMECLSIIENPSLDLLVFAYRQLHKLGHDMNTMLSVMAGHDFQWTEEFQDWFLSPSINRWIHIPEDQLHSKYHYLKNMKKAGIL